MKMEETAQLDTELIQEASQADASPAAEAGQSTNSDATGGSSDDGSKLKRPEKRAPIKLPKQQGGPTTKNTKDAASETLKRYFGGR
jgi:hypothetical protein